MSIEQRDRIEALLRSRELAANPTVAERRERFAALFAGRPLPAGVTGADSTIGGRPGRVLTANATPTTLLFLHGGGYAVGSADTGQPLAAALARRAGGRAVVPDYRLAPEHPFPAAVDDALAAYRELLGAGSPDLITVAGDSAGGGLTVALLVAIRDAGLPQPRAAAVFSPFTDLALTGASIDTHADVDPLFDRAELRWYADNYLGGADDRTPLASPAFADLRGVAPLLIQVGTHEVLLDDAVTLAQRAAAADVDVTLEVVAGMPHVFQLHEGALDEADAALDRAATFLSRATAVGAAA